ncbi:LysR substrate-binding domain-containing protein [Tepidimonas charontis]|uniref:Glycine cleavage system transcriptional activator n=1 Tax=Tepidimonas charontis TaxID=2267262 RepID=A0A554XGM8_9BURK|nr:LysR substrate-binding domain-containing protein [Tepidimonas charontis]TSE34984.1 Glycine cleavage system transcriptional activator [Tepidimonas charontis]
MRRRLPSVQALQCFEAAARHQSFTRAAQELALTQSAVSRQVAALEDFLGVALFRRTQHGMALTAAGADYARQVRQRLDALERDAVALMGRRGQGDSLTLAVVPTFATRWLIPRLPRLAAQQPDLLLHFETCTRPFLFTDTGVDAAIWAGTPEQVRQWAGTQATPLLPEDVLPVCSPRLLEAHTGRPGPLDPAALARLPLLQQATRPDAWRQWFDAQGVDAPRAMAGPRYELFSMQAAAAMAGLGVALMPTLLVQDELASGVLVVACPRPLKAQRAYYLVQPQGDERLALRRFKAWLLDVCREASTAVVLG